MDSAQAVRRIAAHVTDDLPDLAAPGPRRVILHAALKLFAERGFSGASIRDVAAASGVQHATLYSHFPSKEHVLAELARIGHEEHLRTVRAALLDCQPDPRHQLAAYVKAHVGMHTKYPMLAVVANSELHMLSQKLGGPTFEIRKHSESLLRDIVQRGIDRGVFRVKNLWLAVAAIGGMGLRVAYWFTGDAEATAQETADTYAEFALRILNAEELRHT